MLMQAPRMHAFPHGRGRQDWPTRRAAPPLAAARYFGPLCDVRIVRIEMRILLSAGTKKANLYT